MARHINGWVKIYRAAILGDIGANYTRGGLFSALVGIANIQISTVSWKGKPRKLERGEVVTSLTELASLGEVDRSTVLRHLNYLAERGTLIYEKSNKGVLIKLLNFEKYQSHNADGPHQEQQPPHIGPNNDTNNDPTHNKELKNKRKKEEEGPWAEILLRVWNENRGVLPRALALSKDRIKSANQRFKEFPEEQFWIDVVKKMAKSDFCCGRTDGGWKADFDFLLKPDTHLRVNEGKYDNKKHKANDILGVIGA